MKKSLFLLTCIFLVYFLFVKVNAQACENEELNWTVFDNQEIGYIDTSVDSNKLCLEYDNTTYIFELFDFSFYKEKEESPITLGFYQVEKKYDLTPLFIEIRECEINYYSIYCLIDDYYKMVVFYFEDNAFFSDDVKIYDNDSIINNEFRLKYSNFIGIKNTYINYNLPTTMSEISNTKEVFRDYDDFNDASGIKNYIISTDNYISNGIYYDDIIVNYIPRELFFKNCEEAYYGNEYGFYIKTVMIETGVYLSTLSTFLIELSTISFTGTNNLKNHLSFMPLFTIQFSSYTSSFNRFNNYNFASDSCVMPGYSDIELGYSGFTTNYSIENFIGINKGETGYDILTDNGLCITDVYHNFYFEDESNKSISQSNTLLDQTCLYLLGLVPNPFSIMSDLVSGVDIFCQIVSNEYDTFASISNSFVNDNYFFNDLADSTIQKRNNEFYKEISTKFGYYEENIHSYGLGTDNYQNFIYGNLREKYKIEYSYGFCNGFDFETQKSRMIFSACLQSYDITFDFQPIILIFDIDKYSSDSETLINVHNSYMNSMTLNQNQKKIISIYSTFEGFHSIIVNNSNVAYVYAFDENGRELLNKFHMYNVNNQSHIFMNSDLIYFICFEYKQSNYCSINYSISCSDIIVMNSINFQMPLQINAYQAKIIKVYVPTSTYVYTYTSSDLNTCMSIYKDDKRLYYNNDGFIEDDEEDYNAVISGYLESGYYYILVENLSSTSGNVMFII